MDTDAESDSESSPRNRFGLRVTTVLLLIGLFLALALALWAGAQVLLLMFAAVLLAVMLRTAAAVLNRWTKLPVRWALVVVILILALGGGIMVWSAAPGVSEQVTELQENLEASVETVMEKLQRLPGAEEVIGEAEEIQEGNSNGPEIWSKLAGIFSNAFSGLSAILIVLLSAIFLAFDPRLYLSGILRLIPLKRREDACQVLSAVGTTLQWWLVGQLISMLFLFATTWIMLALLGVPLAFILSVLTGLLTFIPYIGPVIAIIPIVLIAFVEDPMLALYTGLLFLLIQNVESSVVMPLVFQRTVALPPAVTIVGQLTLGGLFGILGFILATPLTAVILVLAQKLYVEGTLGDSMDKPVEELPELGSG